MIKNLDLWSQQSVWGSYWKDFRWGYSCCHSTVRGSYCTGQAGKDAARGNINVREDDIEEEEEEEAPKSLVEVGSPC